MATPTKEILFTTTRKDSLRLKATIGREIGRSFQNNLKQTILFERMGPLNILFFVEFLACAPGSHISNLSKHGSFHPRSIVFSKAPKNSRVRIRVSSIEAIFVIEMH